MTKKMRILILNKNTATLHVTKEMAIYSSVENKLTNDISK